MYSPRWTRWRSSAGRAAKRWCGSSRSPPTSASRRSPTAKPSGVQPRQTSHPAVPLPAHRQQFLAQGFVSSQSLLHLNLSLGLWRIQNARCFFGRPSRSSDTFFPLKHPDITNCKTLSVRVKGQFFLNPRNHRSDNSRLLVSIPFSAQACQEQIPGCRCF